MQGDTHPGSEDCTTLPIGHHESFLMRAAHWLLPEHPVATASEVRERTVKAGGATAPPVPLPHRHTYHENREYHRECRRCEALPSDGVQSKGWRAWREPGVTPFAMLLCVSGWCRLPRERYGSRIVLLEVTLPMHNDLAWGDLTADTPILLERVLIPPALEDPAFHPAGTEHAIYVRYERIEEFGRPCACCGMALSPRPLTTHVTILPEGITIPIVEATQKRGSSGIAC